MEHSDNITLITSILLDLYQQSGGELSLLVELIDGLIPIAEITEDMLPLLERGINMENEGDYWRVWDLVDGIVIHDDYSI